MSAYICVEWEKHVRVLKLPTPSTTCVCNNDERIEPVSEFKEVSETKQDPFSEHFFLICNNSSDSMGASFFPKSQEFEGH